MAERDSATCEDVFDIKHSHDWRNVSVYRYGLLLDPPSRRLDYDSFECATCSFYCSDIRFRKRRVRRAIAGIGVTSEAEGAPVESVFDSSRSQTGWRAGTPGLQLIRITFGEPKTIRRIQLEFRESRLERTQEFTLHATSVRGERTEVIRQQWTFSPQGSTQEVEDYRLNLNNISIVELTISPDLNHGDAHASLIHLRIG